MSEEKANPKQGVVVDPLFTLASGSPRRRELLAKLLDDYEVFPTDAEELDFHQEGPLALVMENARLKTMAVAELRPKAWVLGADTLVALGDETFGKPADLVEAAAMLRRLSGKTHEVSTGLCLMCKAAGYEESRVTTSRVTFKELDDETITAYFAEVNPLDKAGAYAIQTRADLIVESFAGSRSNVIGLPLEDLGAWLTEVGITLE